MVELWFTSKRGAACVDYFTPSDLSHIEHRLRTVRSLDGRGVLKYQDRVIGGFEPCDDPTHEGPHRPGHRNWWFEPQEIE